MDRRRFVKLTGAVALGTGLSGCGSSGANSDGDGGNTGGSGDGGGTDGGSDEATGDGDAGGDENDAGAGETQSFDGWMADVGNYDGVVDETGAGEVTVTVGSQANGGAFGFGPAAIAVDAGTTVVWEWSGEGSLHNVAAEDGSFRSDMVEEAGHTFEHTFEEAGTVKYQCEPHATLGMKGVVVVE